MEGLGAISLGGGVLLGQDPLMESFELNPRSASSSQLNQTSDMPKAVNSASVEISEAGLNEPSLFSQPTIVKSAATSSSGHEAKAAGDSLTGTAESAPLVGALATTQDIMINFQPDTTAVPAGFVRDIGQAYDETRGFGWVRQDSLSSTTHVPLDITSNARDRDRTGIDPRLNTLLHMQYPNNIPNSAAVKTPAAWEYALPNGTYNVTVSVGDQPFRGGGYDSQHTINVEGVNVINRFQSRSTQEYKQATVRADVTDGKLTIDPIGGINTKINYLEIKSLVADTSGAIAKTSYPAKDRSYVGINNETGGVTNETIVEKSIAEMNRLELGSVRMGVDKVNGDAVGQPFSFGSRDFVVDSHVAAKIDIHAVVSPVHHVSRGKNDAEWQANWRYFLQNVMQHYKGKIDYYIIGNEPNSSYYSEDKLATPLQWVEMTKIADEVAQSVDSKIQIQSPPVSTPESPFLKEMLQLGVAKYADFIGVHAYGAQIMDGRFSKPWEWMEELGIRKPIAISESGVNSGWAPKGIDGQEWRRRYLPQLYLAAKRYGIDHILLFSLSFKDNSWGFVDRGNNFKIWNPVNPPYSELKNGFQAQVLANGGFEKPNDPEREWIVYYNPDRLSPPQFIDFITGDSSGARSGSGYVKMEAGQTQAPIILRRIAAGLQPGQRYRIQGWAFTNGATATLKGLGFNELDGDREVTATLNKPGRWRRLAADFQASSDHVVVELGTKGTANPGDFVKWDNISIVPLS